MLISSNPRLNGGKCGTTFSKRSDQAGKNFSLLLALKEDKDHIFIGICNFLHFSKTNKKFTYIFLCKLISINSQ